MKADELERQVAAYGRAALEDVPEVLPQAVTTPVLGADEGRRSVRPGIARAPGWAVAMAVTVGVLAVGAAAAFLTLPGAEESAATTAPSPVPVVVPVDPVIVDTQLGTMEWTFRTDRSPIDYGLVEWQGRLVGLASQGDALRATDDGLSWVTVGSLPGVHTPVGLATHDGYLYLIDSRTLMPEGYLIRHPSVWRSSDLRMWEPVTVEQQIPADYIGEVEVVASTTGIVIIAGYGPVPHPPSALLWALTEEGFVASELPPFPGYREAPVAVWDVDGGFAASTGQDVFFSSTGASWTEVSKGTFEDRGIITVGRGPGGYLAIAEYGRTVLTSDDGLTWQRLAIEVGEGGEPTVGFASDLVPIGGGWIAFSDYSPRRSTVLVSVGGAEWTGVTPVSGVGAWDPVAVGPDLILAQWSVFSPDGWFLPGGTVEIRLLGD